MAWKHYYGTDGNDVTDGLSILTSNNVTEAYSDIQLRYDAQGGDDRFDGTTAFVSQYFLYGGDGSDILKASSINGGEVNGGAGNDELYISGQQGFHIEGGSGNDLIDVSANGWNYLAPGLGADTIVGRSSFIDGNGSIYLSYRDINQTGVKVSINSDYSGTVLGYNGSSTNTNYLNDTFTFVRNFEGTPNNDYFFSQILDGNQYVSFDATPGSDKYEGGAGWEHISYNIGKDGYTSGITVNPNGTVTNQFGGTDTLINIDFVAGTEFNDVIYASDHIYHFQGNQGDDTFYGRNDHEFFNPGSGDDVADFVGNNGTLNYNRWGDLKQIDINSLNVQTDWNATGNLTLPNASQTIVNYDGKAEFLDNLNGTIGTIYFDAAAGQNKVYVVGFTGSGNEDVDIVENFDQLRIEFWDQNGTYVQQYNMDWANKKFEAQDIVIRTTTADPNIDLDQVLPSKDVDPQDRNFTVKVEGDDNNNTIDSSGTLVHTEIRTYDGDDTIYAVSSSGGGDQDQTSVSDGDGDDYVEAISVPGGRGVDIIVGAGDDIFIGSGDNDGERLRFEDWARNDQTDDGNFAARGGVTVNFTGHAMGIVTDDGWGGRDEFSNYKRITGSESDDTFIGNVGYQDLDGRGGNDTIYGGADRDNLRGGEGNDLLYGDGGDDHIDGESGNDTLYGGDGDDWLLPGGGVDVLHGGAGNDASDYWISALNGLGARVKVDLNQTSNKYEFKLDAAAGNLAADYLLGEAYFETSNNVTTLKVAGLDGSMSEIDTISSDIEGLSVDYDGGEIWYDIDWTNKTLSGTNYVNPPTGKIKIEGTSGNDTLNVAQMLTDLGYDPLNRDLDVEIYAYAGNDTVNMDGVNAHIEIYDDAGDDTYNAQNNENTVQINETGGGTDTYNVSRSAEFELQIDFSGENYTANDVVIKYDGSIAPELSNISPTEQKALEFYLGTTLAGKMFYDGSGNLRFQEIDIDDGSTVVGTSIFDADDLGYRFGRFDLFGNGGDNGKLYFDVDVETGTLSYVYSLSGNSNNEVIGDASNNYFYDTHMDEIFRTMDGDDYVELWDGGSDTVYLGAGDDVIWPDGWYFQWGNGTPDTKDTIHGDTGYDVIHIDTWGGDPLKGEYLVNLESMTNTTETFRIYSPTDPKEDFKLVLHKDGSGDAYYNYSGYNNHHFLTFTGIERVEFNSLRQTVDRGDENLRWAGFDISSDNIMATSASQMVGRPEKTFNFDGHTYYLLRDYYTFDEAVVKASSLGGRILEIDSEAENNFIFGIMNGENINEIMLGLTDSEHEGIWLTEDDKIIPFSDWGNPWNDWGGREPNDWGAGEDYATTVRGWRTEGSWDLGNWNDIGPGWEVYSSDNADLKVSSRVIVEVDNGDRGNRIDVKETNLTNYQAVAGDEAILGGDADQNLKGLNTADYISGGGGDDNIWGYDGEDSLSGGAGDDHIRGGAGSDRIIGEEGNDTLEGNEGNDFIMGRSGNDTIYGDLGNDSIYGHSGNDTINAGDGNDFIQPGKGNDNVDAGAGWDEVEVEASEPDQTLSLVNTGEYELLSGTTQVGYLNFNHPNVVGGLRLSGFDGPMAEVDEIYNAEALRIRKGITEDGWIYDTYIIDYGAKTLTLLAPNPDYTIPNNETDVIVVDKLAELGYNPYDVYLESTVTGNASNNMINAEGVAGRMHIHGLGGDDTIYANGSTAPDDDDVDQTQVYDGAGNDTVYGVSNGGVGIDINVGSGNDTFYATGDGYWGAERLNFSEDTEGNLTRQGVTVEYTSATSGIIRNDGFGGVDNFFNFGRVTASSQNDTLTGHDGEQRLWGRDGDDTISGAGGNDKLRGEFGNDTLDGGSGDDFLEPGPGNDTVDGGDGFDTAQIWFSTLGVGLTLVTTTGQNPVYKIMKGSVEMARAEFTADANSPHGFKLTVTENYQNIDNAKNEYDGITTSSTDQIINAEQLEFAWNDTSGNWNALRFDVDYANQRLLEREIVIEGTSGDDTIVLADELEARGYDPKNWDLDVDVKMREGDDVVDLTGVNAYVQIFDDDGDDRYFANGETGRIRVRELGDGEDVYDAEELEFRIDVNWNDEGDDVNSNDMSFNLSEGRSHYVTESAPLSLSVLGDKIVDFYFDEVGDFIFRDYFLDDQGNITGYENNVIRDARDYRAFEADFFGNGPDARFFLDINFEDRKVDYILSIEGQANTVNGTGGRDYLFDTRYNETFNAGDGDDYIELWDGGNDVVNAGAGDDEIWPDGWYFQHEGDLTYDIIDGGDGYDRVHIDTWGGTPRQGEYFVDLIVSESSATTNVYRVYSKTEVEEDFRLEINNDGSGSAFYNFYGGHKFLDFENVERIEFNATNQTIERGPDNLKWARFDIDVENGSISAISARDALDSPVETYFFQGHEYRLFDRHMDFDDAVAFADSLGGYLVEIDTAAESNFLYNEILSDGHTDRVMLSVTDREHEGVWLTEDGRYLPFDDWDGWQPDDYDDGQDYATAILGQFNDGDNDLGGWDDRGPDGSILIEFGPQNIGLPVAFTDQATVTISSNSGYVATVGTGAVNQTFTGSTADDVISAGDGSDQVNGGAGNDRIFGDKGNDNLIGGEGNDLLQGDEGSDDLDGGAGEDILRGGEGDDYIVGGADRDEIYGGYGDDGIDANDGTHDFINPGIGSDTIVADSQDTVYYEVWVDEGDFFINPIVENGQLWLDAQAKADGDDPVAKFVGNDVIVQDPNGFDEFGDHNRTDTITGAGEILGHFRSRDDRSDVGEIRIQIDHQNKTFNVDFEAEAGRLEYRVSDMGAPNISVYDTLVGNNFDPSRDDLEIAVFGDGANNLLTSSSVAPNGTETDPRDVNSRIEFYGGAGDDFIRGGDANDHIEGGSGNDIIYAEEDLGWGDWVMPGTGQDNIFGNEDLWYDGGGTDLGYQDLNHLNVGIKFFMHDDGNGWAHTNDHTNASINPSTQHSAPNGVASWDEFEWIDYVHGTDDDDIFTLPNNHQFGVRPGAGDDVINGGTGNAYSWIKYSDSDAQQGIIVSFNNVAETISSASVSTLSSDLSLSANASNSGTIIDAWGDTDTVSHIDRVGGTNFQDVFFGSEVEDEFEGEDGDDIFYLGAGNDRVDDGGGSDFIDGGAGYDVLDRESHGGSKEVFDQHTTDVPYGTTTSSMQWFSGRTGQLGGRMSFDQSGDLIWERGFGTSGYERNVLSNVERIEVSYFDEDGNYFGEINTEVNYTDKTFVSSLGQSQASSGGNGFVNTDGADNYDGSVDTWDYADYRDTPAAVTIDVAQGKALNDGYGKVDTFTSVEEFRLSNSNDTFSGSDTATHSNGSIYGQFISWMPWSKKIGYEVVAGNAGDDNLDGKGGYDEIAYSSANTGITIDLRTGTVADDGHGDTDTIANFEGVEGTKFDDVIHGTDGDNSLDGGLGNDTVYAHGGTDILEFNGWSRENLNITLNSGNGTATFDSNGQSYTTTFSGFEGIVGSNGNDSITGDSANNYLIGWHGNDTVRGMGGNDHLYGGTGNDTLEGGSGNDTYYYLFEGVTRINDSGGSSDKVVITTRDFDGNGYWSHRTYFEGADLIMESRTGDGSELIIENAASSIEGIVWRSADPNKNWGNTDSYDGSKSTNPYKPFKFTDAGQHSYSGDYFLVGTNGSEVINLNTSNGGHEVYAGAGNDTIMVSGGNSNRSAWITGGEGNDTIKSFDDDPNAAKQANILDVVEWSGDEFYLSNGYGKMYVEDFSGTDTAILNWNAPDDGSYISSDPVREGDDFVVYNKSGAETFRFKNAFSENQGLERVQFHNPYTDNPATGVNGDYYQDSNGNSTAFNLAKTTYVDQAGPWGWVVVGTDQAETLTNATASTNADIYANGGNDTINLGSAYSWAFGGAGDDTINLGTGEQNVYGGDGDDLFVGSRSEWQNKTIHDIELGDKIVVEFATGGRPALSDVAIAESTTTAGEYALTIKGSAASGTVIKGATGLSFAPAISASADGGFKVSMTAVQSVTTATLSDADTTADTVSEGASNGTAVGITASAGQGYTYALSNDADGRFGISSTTGVVTVADNLLIDYELATSHEIEVEATDTNGIASYKTFTVAVTDKTNEPYDFVQLARTGDTITYGAKLIDSTILASGTKLESFSSEIVFDPNKVSFVDGSVETILDDASGFTLTGLSKTAGSAKDNVLSVSNISYSNIPSMDLSTTPVFTFDVNLIGQPKVLGFETRTSNGNIDFVGASNISLSNGSFEAFGFSKASVTGSAKSGRKGVDFDGSDPRYGKLEAMLFETPQTDGIFLRATKLGDSSEFEVVVKPGANIASFGFTLTGSNDIYDFETTSALTSFGTGPTLSNQINAKTVALASTSLDTTINSGTEFVAATFKMDGLGSILVSDATLAGVSQTNFDATLSAIDYSDETGFSADVAAGAFGQIAAQADYSASGANPITPSDALEVLKTVVRINQSPTEEQLIAGDVDGDGKLTPSDALAILKNVVRMDGGVDPEWIFVDKTADFSSMTSTAVNFTNVIDLGVVSGSANLEFEGILLGDWDGSL